MTTFFHSGRRCHDVSARQLLSAVIAGAALSACSGKKAGPTSVIEPDGSIALTVSGSGSGSGRVMSTPAGIACSLAAGAVSGSCTARFPAGSVVTLSPEPGTTSVFLAFGGDCALASCQTTMQAPRIVTATFVPNFLSVVANAASVGGGRIVSSPAGIDCILNATAPGTGSCSSSFPLGTEVTLTQEPAAGATFAAWSAQCSGDPCLVIMNGQRTVDATYRVSTQPPPITPPTQPPTLPQGSVSIAALGTGSGTVISSPAGLFCTITNGVAGGGCSASFDAGVAVTLSATASGGGTFSGYSGACSGSTCTISVASGTTSAIGALFATTIPAALTVRPSPASHGYGTITSSPAGINCTVNDGAASGVCSGAFPTNTLVTLTQIAGGSSIFQGWSGDCIGNPCQVSMSQPRVGEITYRIPPPGIVTLTGTGTGTGSVTSSPSGISCTMTAGVASGICSATFDAGSTVTLIAGSSNNGSFDGFSGACTGGSCAIASVTGVTSQVSAAFSAAPQRLTVTAGPGSAGGGVITSAPTGINCVLSGSTTSGTCTAFFAANTVVTLQQVTTGNAVFAEWAGDCVSDPCQLAMTQGRTALAIFQTQGIAVAGGGSGSGTVTSVPAGINCTVTNGVTGGTCATTFPPNVVVTLNASPAGIASFSGYSGACTASTCTLTMTPGTMNNVTAQFTAPPVLTLSAALGSQGGGTLGSSPAGLSCTLSNAATSGACNYAYALNTVVTVTQTPTSGSVFLNWVGACSGTGVCSVPLTASRSVQALYRLAVPGSITVLSGGGTGSGSVSSSPGGLACSIANGTKSGICRAIFPVGSTVTMVPSASSGSTFTGFSGSCSGMTCVLTVPENGDLTVTANFTP
jgi:hypothetical protein